jgi:putative phosphoribosyl transferase
MTRFPLYDHFPYHIFHDRAEAGKSLAAKLETYANRPGALVLALPRGGVPVGFEVSRALNAPLDVFVVRKLGMPGHEELAMGAIASGGVKVINRDVVQRFRIQREIIEAVASREAEELVRRERLYRGNKPAPEISGRLAILVDDGLATGSSMSAALEALRKQNPDRIVVGVPVAAPSTCDEFRAQVDDIVCAVTPEPFYGVGMWYEDFSQTSDQEIHELLEQASRERPSGSVGEVARRTS